MNSIVVLKFGGSVLQDEVSISKATEIVRNLKSKSISTVTVISAMKGVTDGLIALSKKVNPNVSPWVLAEILSMGERTSARLFTNALIGKGMDPVLVDTESELWPIITDENPLDAMIEVNGTRRLVREKIVPLIEKGKVPVICGFLGKTQEGRVTTLGRGGSDTTAVAVGSILGAKEVVLIKDVETVYSSDPDKVQDPVPLQELDAEEALILSAGGAKFLHPKALQYKTEGLRIRIASLDQTSQGTVIEGGSLELKIEASGEEVIMITILRNPSSNMEHAGSGLVHTVNSYGGRVISVSMNERALVVYASGGSDLINRVHNYVLSSSLGKAMSSFENLAVITIKGSLMETSPGLIQMVTQPLARHGINIYGLSTIGSAIKVFVQKDQRERSVALLREALVEAKEDK